MSITKTSTRIDERQEIHGQACLDVGTIPIAYGRSGKHWRPAWVGVRWARDRVNGGEWSPWSLLASVAGPKVKNDGTDSQVTHMVRIVGASGLSERDIPATVILWIQGSRPDTDELPQPYRRPIEDDVPAGDGRLDLDLV